MHNAWEIWFFADKKPAVFLYGGRFAALPILLLLLALKKHIDREFILMQYNRIIHGLSS